MAYRPLRRGIRARRLRRRHGGRPARPGRPRHRRPGPHRARAPGPPGRLGSRGGHRRRGRDPGPGPAPLPAGEADAAGFALPERRALRRRAGLPAQRRRRRRQGQGQWSSPGRRGGPARARLAHGAHRVRRCWARPPWAPADHRAALRAPRRRGVRRDDAMALERQAFVLRKRVEHAVDGLYFPSLSARTLVYKGMFTSAAAAPVLPRPARPAFESGSGPGPLPLLHQHLPELAPGPPLPVPGPQRRDQHRGRQPQLDAGPRGAARHLPHRGRPGPHLPGLHPGGQRLGQFRRGARAPAPGRPLPAPRRADDDPRGVGEPRHHGPGTPGLLPLPRLAHGALGRAGGRRLHRRHGGRRRARPQRPAPGPLLGHRRRPGGPGQRGGRPRHRPRAHRAQGPAPARPHVPGRHGGRAASSTTTRSRPSWPPSTPTASGWPTTRSGSTSCPPAPCSPPSTVGSSPSNASSATPPRSCGSFWPPWPAPAASRSGSMGSDAAIAVLSDRSRLLYDYFTQLFAQVTNPPLDAIREELVTSLGATVGPEGNLLDARPGLVPPDPAAPAGHRPRRPGQAAVRQRARRDARLQGLRHRRSLRGGRGRGSRGGHPGRRPGAGRGHRGRAPAGVRGHRRGGQPHRPLRPQRHGGVGPHPLAAPDRGRAPPPGAGEDADPGGPGGRDRRRPRGAPHGAPHRLRRRRRQPVPGPRHASTT